MKRREVYGTSGPRIVARFFGGWTYGDALCNDSEAIAKAYRDGVPMGGELRPRPASGTAAPRFLVWALRDPGGNGVPSTPLQRIQIVKGWLDGDQSRERVFDVAGDANSAAQVDLASCTPQGTGYAQLCNTWEDPDFDPSAPAFYYMRVVENPSCRWNQWTCVKAGVDCAAGAPDGLDACCDETIPRTIQERAWSSPIWFHPDPRQGPARISRAGG
jgi:hypothetical protein